MSVKALRGKKYKSLKYKNPFTPASTSGWLYVIRGIGTEMYKVGFTRRDPEKRMAELQAYSPVRLELFGAARGTYQDEQRWHRAMTDFASHGEWYFISDSVLRDIANAIDNETAAALERQIEWYAPKEAA